ncbi:MAG: hypothetical protein KGQ88_06640 [Chloroflexi bacterium]|nr:hypothetical protein [Chloroflexota bacterium]
MTLTGDPAVVAGDAVTTRAVAVPAVTTRLAVALTLPELAVMVYVPAVVALHELVAPVVGTQLAPALALQPAVKLGIALPLVSKPAAVYAARSPDETVAVAGVIVIFASAAAVTVSVALFVIMSEVAVIV